MTFETDDRARVTLVPHPFGLRISGEIDRGNRHLLAGALAWALLAGSHDIRLDLSGLTFIDVSGMRLVVVAAARLSADRTLVLDPISPAVRRILALTGWEQAPGLHVCS
ncbi:STAS domain-containing protein [Nonomuraea sp. PA05]|uniref:STAS domain-containing protein n=1 Tax=Nonomuraea sp. PA05 TaxID=2604466 RepID=UPI0011D4DDF7|nr:STAS domain-containing protein [Nonomuraea sp. PA05]TYB67651.1 STAS domain-containing protein [Nonomuraea sp. PA05]